MDYVGLTFKYKTNRPLTDGEKERHLLQGEPSHSPPKHCGQVIRMNSAYLECVDKFFMNKGVMSAVMIAIVGIFSWGFGYLTYLMVIDGEYGQATILFLLTFLILFIATKFFLLKECFTYTHFPIRFNRKTRKVHVFRQNGTVMTEDWDKLYFTRCQRTYKDWEVRGHRLAEDGVTVLETFGLPAPEGSPWKTPFWEFVRRYMEAPDELLALAGQIENHDHIVDVADQRECVFRGAGRVSSDLSPFFITLLFPVVAAYALGRVIANYTSRIPKWPAEIEAECQIEPDDPYIRDAKHLAPLPKELQPGHE
jgi:hypothetical protein